MTGKELKAARRQLGLTQEKLGDAINLTRVMIGLMERDQKPMDRRTELAVRCLLHEQNEEDKT